MNVILDEQKENKKLKIFYILIIIVCIVAVILAIVLEKAQNEKNSGNNSILSGGYIEQVDEVKVEFNNMFENKVNYLKNNSYKISKIKNNEEIIYLGYQNNESKINDFELDVNIPYINIDNEVIQKFNTQIKETFEQKAKNILNTQNNNTVYTVDYSAFVSNNVLSLIVRSTLKEGSNPQRDIIQTYNYDLEKQQECTIDNMLEMKSITKKEANQRIKGEINKVQKNVEELRKLGYEVYIRDYTNDRYSINNVTEYFMGKDNKLYIIFAYGNENHTSEMDIIIM